MALSWEAVTAVASILSSFAVVAALLIAARQVRVGAAQVEHLRRATQLEGTMAIFALLTSHEQQAARRYILHELAPRLDDDGARALTDAWETSGEPSVEDRRWLPALSLIEMLGIYVKHGLLDADIVFDYWVPAVSRIWELLESRGIIAAQRRLFGEEMWENYEYLYHRYQAYHARTKKAGRLAVTARSASVAAPVQARAGAVSEADV